MSVTDEPLTFGYFQAEQDPTDEDLDVLLDPPPRRRPQSRDEAEDGDRLLLYTGPHELQEAIWNEKLHPRWPKGTPLKGGEFIRVGERFNRDGHEWEVTQVAGSKIIAAEASGDINQAHTRVFDTAEELEGVKHALPGAVPAAPKVLKSGFVQEINPKTGKPYKMGSGHYKKTVIPDENSVVIDADRHEETHDPSIAPHPLSKLTPEQWAKFGRADQLFYNECMDRFGAWQTPGGGQPPPISSGSPQWQAKLNAIKKNAPASAVSTLESMISDVKGHTEGNQMSGVRIFEGLLNSSPQLATAQAKYQQFRELESDMNSLIAWDLYNRLGAPDITAVHRAPGEEVFKQAIAGKKSLLSGLSTSWKMGVWSGHGFVFSLPVRQVGFFETLMGQGWGAGSGEFELATMDRLKVAEQAAGFYTKDALPDNPGKAGQPGQLYKFLAGQMNSNGRGGGLAALVKRHFATNDPFTLDIGQVDLNFQVTKKPGQVTYYVPPDDVMSHIEDAVAADPGTPAWDKQMLVSEMPDDMKPKPGMIVEKGGQQAGTRYLVIQNNALGPGKFQYVPLLTGSQDYDVNPTGGGYVSDKCKVILGDDGKPMMFSLPPPPAEEAYKHDMASLTPGGPKIPVGQMELGDAIAFNNDHWKIIKKTGAQVTVQSMTNGTEGVVDSLAKQQKLYPTGTAPPTPQVPPAPGVPTPQVPPAPTFIPEEGKDALSSQFGIVKVVDAADAAQGDVLVETPTGMQMAHLTSELSPAPGLPKLAPQKGDTFTKDGFKYTIQNIQKNGIITARPFKPGEGQQKVEKFVPFVPTGSQAAQGVSQLPSDLLRPDDYEHGDKAKLGSLQPGDLVSGSAATKKPFMVLGHYGKNTYLRNLDTGEVVPVSKNKSYTKLTSKAAADDVKVDAQNGANDFLEGKKPWADVVALHAAAEDKFKNSTEYPATWSDAAKWSQAYADAYVDKYGWGEADEGNDLAKAVKAAAKGEPAPTAEPSEPPQLGDFIKSPDGDIWQINAEYPDEDQWSVIDTQTGQGGVFNKADVAGWEHAEMISDLQEPATGEPSPPAGPTVAPYDMYSDQPSLVHDVAEDHLQGMIANSASVHITANQYAQQGYAPGDAYQQAALDYDVPASDALALKHIVDQAAGPSQPLTPTPGAKQVGNTLKGSELEPDDQFNLSPGGYKWTVTGPPNEFGSMPVETEDGKHGTLAASDVVTYLGKKGQPTAPPVGVAVGQHPATFGDLEVGDTYGYPPGYADHIPDLKVVAKDADGVTVQPTNVPEGHAINKIALNEPTHSDVVIKTKGGTEPKFAETWGDVPVGATWKSSLSGDTWQKTDATTATHTVSGQTIDHTDGDTFGQTVDAPTTALPGAPVAGQMYKASTLPPGSKVKVMGSSAEKAASEDQTVGNSGTVTKWGQPIPGSGDWPVEYVGTEHPTPVPSAPAGLGPASSGDLQVGHNFKMMKKSTGKYGAEYEVLGKNPDGTLHIKTLKTKKDYFAWNPKSYATQGGVLITKVPEGAPSGPAMTPVESDIHHAGYQWMDAHGIDPVTADKAVTDAIRLHDGGMDWPDAYEYAAGQIPDSSGNVPPTGWLGPNGIKATIAKVSTAKPDDLPIGATFEHAGTTWTKLDTDDYVSTEGEHHSGVYFPASGVVIKSTPSATPWPGTAPWGDTGSDEDKAAFKAADDYLKGVGWSDSAVGDVHQAAADYHANGHSWPDSYNYAAVDKGVVQDGSLLANEVALGIMQATPSAQAKPVPTAIPKEVFDPAQTALDELVPSDVVAAIHKDALTHHNLGEDWPTAYASAVADNGYSTGASSVGGFIIEKVQKALTAKQPLYKQHKEAYDAASDYFKGAGISGGTDYDQMGGLHAAANKFFQDNNYEPGDAYKAAADDAGMDYKGEGWSDGLKAVVDQAVGSQIPGPSGTIPASSLVQGQQWEHPSGDHYEVLNKHADGTMDVKNLDTGTTVPNWKPAGQVKLLPPSAEPPSGGGSAPLDPAMVPNTEGVKIKQLPVGAVYAVPLAGNVPGGSYIPSKIAGPPDESGSVPIESGYKANGDAVPSHIWLPPGSAITPEPTTTTTLPPGDFTALPVGAHFKLPGPPGQSDEWQKTGGDTAKLVTKLNPNQLADEGEELPGFSGSTVNPVAGKVFGQEPPTMPITPYSSYPHIASLKAGEQFQDRTGAKYEVQNQVNEYDNDTGEKIGGHTIAIPVGGTSMDAVNIPHTYTDEDGREHPTRIKKVKSLPTSDEVTDPKAKAAADDFFDISHYSTLTGKVAAIHAEAQATLKADPDTAPSAAYYAAASHAGWSDGNAQQLADHIDAAYPKPSAGPVAAAHDAAMDYLDNTGVGGSMAPYQIDQMHFDVEAAYAANPNVNLGDAYHDAALNQGWSKEWAQEFGEHVNSKLGSLSGGALSSAEADDLLNQSLGDGEVHTVKGWSVQQVPGSWDAASNSYLYHLVSPQGTTHVSVNGPDAYALMTGQPAGTATLTPPAPELPQALTPQHGQAMQAAQQLLQGDEPSDILAVHNDVIHTLGLDPNVNLGQAYHDSAIKQGFSEQTAFDLGHTVVAATGEPVPPKLKTVEKMGDLDVGDKYAFPVDGYTGPVHEVVGKGDGSYGPGTLKIKGADGTVSEASPDVVFPQKPTLVATADTPPPRVPVVMPSPLHSPAKLKSAAENFDPHTVAQYGGNLYYKTKWGEWVKLGTDENHKYTKAKMAPVEVRTPNLDNLEPTGQTTNIQDLPVGAVFATPNGVHHMVLAKSDKGIHSVALGDSGSYDGYKQGNIIWTASYQNPEVPTFKVKAGATPTAEPTPTPEPTPTASAFGDLPKGTKFTTTALPNFAEQGQMVSHTPDTVYEKIGSGTTSGWAQPVDGGPNVNFSVEHPATPVTAPAPTSASEGIPTVVFDAVHGAMSGDLSPDTIEKIHAGAVGWHDQGNDWPNAYLNSVYNHLGYGDTANVVADKITAALASHHTDAAGERLTPGDEVDWAGLGNYLYSGPDPDNPGNALIHLKSLSGQYPVSKPYSELTKLASAPPDPTASVTPVSVEHAAAIQKAHDFLAPYGVSADEEAALHKTAAAVKAKQASATWGDVYWASIGPTITKHGLTGPGGDQDKIKAAIDGPEGKPTPQNDEHAQAQRVADDWLKNSGAVNLTPKQIAQVHAEAADNISNYQGVAIAYQNAAEANGVSPGSAEMLSDAITDSFLAPPVNTPAATTTGKLPEAEPPIPDYNGVSLAETGGAGGTTGAKNAVDPNGTEWLVKSYGGNEDRVGTELLANAVYRAMGLSAAKAGMLNQGGKTVLAYPKVGGQMKSFSGSDQAKMKALGQGVMTDALLANWDFVGAVDDNVLWNGNEPTRIDQGGSFMYRAQGKTKKFGPVPDDLKTMLTIGQGANGVSVSESQLRDQAAQVAKTLTPEKIDALVDAAPFKTQGMREQIRDNLKKRVQWMQEFADGQHSDMLDGIKLAPDPKKIVSTPPTPPTPKIAPAAKIKPSGPTPDIADLPVAPFLGHKDGSGTLHPKTTLLQVGEQFKDKNGKQGTVVSNGPEGVIAIMDDGKQVTIAHNFMHNGKVRPTRILKV